MSKYYDESKFNNTMKENRANPLLPNYQETIDESYKNNAIKIRGEDSRELGFGDVCIRDLIEVRKKLTLKGEESYRKLEEKINGINEMNEQWENQHRYRMDLVRIILNRGVVKTLPLYKTYQQIDEEVDNKAFIGACNDLALVIRLPSLKNDQSI